MLKVIPILILLGKFGVAMAFTLLYISPLRYFPSKFMGKVFGICNVIGRIVTIFAPMIAESPGTFSVPEMTIILTCIVGAIASSFLNMTKDKSD